MGEIRFNPIVSFFSIALIWIFVGVCIGYSHDNALGEGKNILTEFKVMKIYISCGTELQIHVTAFIH